MQDFQMNWGLLSAAIIFFSGFPYVLAIIKGEVSKPVISTWILWSVIGTLLLVTSY